MKFSEFQALGDGEARRPVTLVLGPEDALRLCAVNRLKALHASDAAHVFWGPRTASDAREFDAGDVVGEMLTRDLFAPGGKVVIVRQAGVLLGQSGGAFAEVLASAAGRVPAGVALVLEAEKADRRRAGVKALAAGALVVECERLYTQPPPWRSQDPPWRNDANAWLVGLLKARGKRVSPEVAQRVVDRAGGDAGVLEREAEKIAVYTAARREVTEEDALALAPAAREEAAWDVADAVVLGKRTEALTRLDGLLAGGDAAFSLLGLVRVLSDRFRIVDRASRLSGEVRDPRALAEAVGQRPFLAERLAAEVAARRGDDCAARYAVLARADREVRDGGAAARLAATRLVMDLCRPARAKGG